MISTPQSRLGLVVSGLLIGIFIAAIDNTIVATAMGTIVSELGGLDQFVWVTSVRVLDDQGKTHFKSQAATIKRDVKGATTRCSFFF